MDYYSALKKKKAKPYQSSERAGSAGKTKLATQLCQAVSPEHNSNLKLTEKLKFLKPGSNC